MARSTEYVANVQGFTSYDVSRKQATTKASFNYVKAFGYCVALLAIAAVVFN